MGKNQAYKAMQRSRLGSSSAAPEEVEDGMEEELRKGELEADNDRMMIKYRAQLDSERAHKLAHGRNHSSIKFSRKKDKKDRDSRKHSSKKRKHSRRSSDSSSSSSSETSSTDDDEREAKRSKSRLKRRKKEKRHSSRSKKLSKGDEEAHGPLPLSRYFGNLKG